MTLGTSPHPLGAALHGSAEAETRAHTARVQMMLEGVRTLGRELASPGARLAKPHRVTILRILGGIYLAALAVVLASTGGMASFGDSLHIGQVHLAFLMLAGAGMAIASLNVPRLFPEVREEPKPLLRSDFTGLGDILAQMSHELRTPLNAVIGFSEVMRHELHGPLNARYQEYAIHISESGDRMLKSSQDALAVAEAMTVLLAKTPHLPKERVSVAVLLEDAWRAVGGAAMDTTACGPLNSLVVERRATTQALEHILREALGRASGPEGVQAFTSVCAEGPRLKVRACGEAQAFVNQTNVASACAYPKSGSAGLNVLLARLLIEAQGGSLKCEQEADGTWSAEMTFRTAA